MKKKLLVMLAVGLLALTGIAATKAIVNNGFSLTIGSVSFDRTTTVDLDDFGVTNTDLSLFYSVVPYVEVLTNGGFRVSIPSISLATSTNAAGVIIVDVTANTIAGSVPVEIVPDPPVNP